MKNQNPEKKARELDEREQVVKLREDMVKRDRADIEKSHAELGVIDKQIEAKKKVLASHNEAIDKAILKHDDTLQSLATKEDRLAKSIRFQEEKLSKLSAKEVSITSSLTTKRAELSDVADQLKEAKKYLKEQGEITSRTISEWNITLQEFRDEADTIQSEKNKLSADIIRLEQDKTVMAVEINRVQANLEALQATYLQKVEEYKGSLKQLDVELNNKKNELYETDTLFDARRIEVEAKEKSIKLKEASATKRERELDQKERRLKGAYGMASIPWDGV